MPNRFFSEVHPDKERGGPRIVKTRMREDRGSARDKPGFPGAALPGKTQPRDRSNGVKRLKAHPKSTGL